MTELYNKNWCLKCMLFKLLPLKYDNITLLYWYLKLIMILIQTLFSLMNTEMIFINKVSGGRIVFLRFIQSFGFIRSVYCINTH